MDKLDGIVYINLESRQDRKEELENELSLLGINFERFDAFPTPGFGILGCGLSHLGVIKLAKERGYRNVLILEDDAHFVLNREEIDHHLNKVLDSKIEYDILFLSYIIYKGEDTEHHFLRRGLHTTTATAYVVNQHYYDEMINLYEYSTKKLGETKEHWNYANDAVWKDLQARDKWYCLLPICCIQKAGYSDNAQSYQDYTNNYEQYYKK